MKTMISVDLETTITEQLRKKQKIHFTLSMDLLHWQYNMASISEDGSWW